MQYDKVLIKSYPNGIRIILPSNKSFDDCIIELKDKLIASGKFFNGSKIALELEGQSLTEDQEKEIILVLEQEANIEVVCIISKDDSRESFYAKAIRRSIPPTSKDDQIYFHHGNLVDGDHLSSDKSIVIFGSAEKGSHIESARNIYVYGDLCGNVIAGTETGIAAKICALCLHPEAISLSGHEANDKLIMNLSKKGSMKFASKVEWDDRKQTLVVNKLESTDLGNEE